MRAKKIHFASEDDVYMGVCRVYGDENEDYDNITDRQGSVTCGHCLKWLAKQDGEVKVLKETLVFEVTDDLRVALKFIGKIGASWADRTNQCRTYDEAIKHINSKLPEGAFIPSRLTTWILEVGNKNGSIKVNYIAKTKEEAIQAIKNQAVYFSNNIGAEALAVTCVGKVE